MNRRQRALRNRQDRSKLFRQKDAEQHEPKLDTAALDAAQNETDAKSEPTLNIENEIKSESAAPKASDSVVDGMSAQSDDKEEVSSEAQSVLDSATVSSDEKEAEQLSSFSATELAKSALKANYGKEQEDMASENSDSQSETADDPDKVPVATTLTDEEVPNCPGAILMHAREILGLTQREVAYKLNCRVNVISDIEHDRLNQVTAIPFASAHIANYARLVNIDPKLLVTLYKQNVQKVVSEQAFAQKENSSAKNSSAVKKLVKAALIAGGAIALAAVGVAVFSGSNSEKDSGAIVIEDTVQATSESDGSLSIDTENSKMKSNIVPADEIVAAEDPNTALARKQAMALDTNDIIDSKAKSNQPSDAQSEVSLELKGEALAKAKANSANAQLVEEEPLFEDNSLQAVSIDDGKSTVKAKKDSSKTAQDTLALKTASDKKPETVKAEASVKAETKASAPVKAEADSVNKAQEAKKAQEEAKVQSPVLASSLRDVSAQVRVANPEPLGSVNSVLIKVSGDVALKITANGRVVKQGSFRAGETVSAVGVPPFVVSATDSSKIQVNYRGGRVVAPSAKQVSFTLPQR